MPTITELMVRVGVQTGDLDKGLKQSETKVAQLADDVEKQGARMSAGFAAAGVAAGAALGQGIASSIEFEAAEAKLSASLGATEELSAAAGDAAGALYADAYGGSMGEVTEAVGAVVSSIDGMRDANDDAIQDMTAKAMTIADLFEVDVTRAAQVAGQMITSGLATDGAQAMDLLTASMQAVPAAVREDILDAVDEYGPFMTQIGIQGEQAMNLLVAAAEDGAFGIDKTGDALKEFTIRATDMSAATGDAYATLGMDMDTMTTQLLAGGDTADQAFTQIVEGLLGITDSADQSTAALALFGTPLEDLSTAEIPAFLEQLANTTDLLGDVEGATDAAGEEMYDTAQTKITTFQRQMELAMAEIVGAPGIIGDAAAAAGVLGGAILPIAGDLGGVALAMGGVIKAGPGVRDAFRGALDTIGALPGQAKNAAAGVSNSFRAMSTAGKTATIGLGGIGIALAAAAVAAELFGDNNAEAAGNVAELADTLDPATAAITADTEAKVANILETEGVLEAAQMLGIEFDTVVGAALGYKDDTEDLNAALGNLDDAQRKAFYSAVGTADGLSQEEEAALLVAEAVPGMAEQLEAAVEKQERVAEGGEAAATATEKHATASERAAEAARDQVEALSELADELKAQTDPVFAMFQAQEQVAEAQEAVNEALEEFGVNSPEYESAVVNFAQDVRDLQTTAAEAGDEFSDELPAALEAAMEKYGASEAELAILKQVFADTGVEVGDLNELLDQTPEAVNTEISSNALEMTGIQGALNLTYDNTPGAVNTEVGNTALSAQAFMQGAIDTYNRTPAAVDTNITSNAVAKRIEAGGYIDTVNLTPDNIGTMFASNATQAQGPVRGYQGLLGSIPRNITTVLTTIRRTVGGLFGGGKAEGGPVSMGQVALVGEEGPELVRFASAGHVIPADETERLLAGGLEDGTLPGLRDMVRGDAGGLGGGRVELVITGDGSRYGNFLATELRRLVRQRGGSVEAVIGQGRG